MKLLDHENIAKLLDVIDMEETLFLVTEYMRGGDIRTSLDEQGRMTEKEAQRPLPAAPIGPEPRPLAGHRAPGPETKQLAPCC